MRLCFDKTHRLLLDKLIAEKNRVAEVKELLRQEREKNRKVLAEMATGRKQ